MKQRVDSATRWSIGVWLASLPDVDDWPFLVREMFSATFNDHVSVAYSYRPVHFAASLKEVE